MFRLGRPKRGVVHAERGEDPLFEKLIERHPRDHFDDATQDVGGHRVVPRRARVEHERQCRIAIADLLQVVRLRNAVVETRAPIHVVDRVVVVESVGQSRRVGQQVPHTHLFALRFGERRQRRPATEHLRLAERRDEFAHFVGELQLALLDEHHAGDRGDRLGHRVDAIHRVCGDRERVLDVAHAIVAHVCHLAVAGDGDRVAGQPAVVHVGSEVVVDAREALRAHSHFFRSNRRRDLCHCLPPSDPSGKATPGASPYRKRAASQSAKRGPTSSRLSVISMTASSHPSGVPVSWRSMSLTIPVN